MIIDEFTKEKLEENPKKYPKKSHKNPQINSKSSQNPKIPKNQKIPKNPQKNSKISKISNSLHRAHLEAEILRWIVFSYYSRKP